MNDCQSSYARTSSPPRSNLNCREFRAVCRSRSAISSVPCGVGPNRGDRPDAVGGADRVPDCDAIVGRRAPLPGRGAGAAGHTYGRPRTGVRADAMQRCDREILGRPSAAWNHLDHPQQFLPRGVKSPRTTFSVRRLIIGRSQPGAKWCAGGAPPRSDFPA